MPDLETRLALMEQQLSQILSVGRTVQEDVRSLHADQRDLALKVASLPMQSLEGNEKRFAPRGRFEVLEKTFYGLMAAVLAGVAGMVIKDQMSPERAASAAVLSPAAIEETWRRPIAPGPSLDEVLQ